jgi:hypothetical protein
MPWLAAAEAHIASEALPPVVLHSAEGVVGADEAMCQLLNNISSPLSHNISFIFD